jgi:hypothetical protein
VRIGRWLELEGAEGAVGDLGVFHVDLEADLAG